ncbi:Gfo/Idh/MocA family protein [Deinococcus pimensis]|uniref:Gfo/Idh/MocA family protein n=1 Tax=Deinococcus pimensis TaxID=309888 RepID=UPI000481B288|nr:Gfo/Idh/MocA family oxidoreductase [Deinococcus pimensis]
MTKLRWGFLGASRIGRGALAPAVHTAGHTLLAVAARDPSRAEAFAREQGAARAYGSYEELLADPDVDLVYNALPNDAHLPLTVAALEAGKHVLCEKPLAMNAHEVRELRAAERRTGRVVLEAFSYRFHPQIDAAREIVLSGELGEVRAARAAFSFTLDRPDDFRWKPEQGGGGLYDVGCYCVNAVRRVLDREPRRAWAVSRDEGGVDVHLAGLLDLGGGVSAGFDCGISSAYHQFLEVVGERSVLRLARPYSSKGTEVTLTVGDDVRTFEPMDPYAEMVAHLGRVALGEEAPRFPLAESEAQALVLDALFESARTGRVVEIPAVPA